MGWGLCSSGIECVDGDLERWKWRLKAWKRGEPECSRGEGRGWAEDADEVDLGEDGAKASIISLGKDGGHIRQH